MIGRLIMDFDFIEYQELQQPFNQEPVIRVEEATIVHIWRGGSQNGLVTISFEDRRNNELTTLIITPQTIIQNSSGRRMSLDELRTGMMVNAIYSSRMTRSIPPQALAFLVVVIERRERTFTTEGRVTNVDRRNNTLEIRERGRGRDDRDDRGRDDRGRDDRDDRGRDDRDDRGRDDRGNRILFQVRNNTVILDRRGRRINLGDIRRDDRVRVEFQIIEQPRRPRQNVAIRIQLL